jgi:nicotinate-nucleotide adenylyltransferase
MRLGIFGGTFDPPHIGHTILADEALYQLKLDRVLWVLTLDPPHKRSEVITELDHRLAMVSAAIRCNQKFELSRVDMDRPAPHYAVDTVKLIQNEYPNSKIVYLLGGDSLENLPLWYCPREFVKRCHELGVMRRMGTSYEFEKLENKIPGIAEKIKFVDTPLIEIAASQLRTRIREKRSYRYYLPPPVFQVIENRQLYRY